jgi:hypothetical protein
VEETSVTGVFAIDGPQPARKGIAAKAIRDIATFIEFFIEFSIISTSAREDAAKLSFCFQPIFTLASVIAAALERVYERAHESVPRTALTFVAS